MCGRACRNRVRLKFSDAPSKTRTIVLPVCADDNVGNAVAVHVAHGHVNAAGVAGFRNA